MNAHTAGPWRVNYSNIRHRAEIIAPDHSTVAKCWPDSGGDYTANAKLISAAPELLAALEAMYDEFYTEGYNPDCALGKAFAAIAKAKGE